MVSMTSLMKIEQKMFDMGQRGFMGQSVKSPSIVDGNFGRKTTWVHLGACQLQDRLFEIPATKNDSPSIFTHSRGVPHTLGPSQPPLNRVDISDPPKIFGVLRSISGFSYPILLILVPIDASPRVISHGKNNFSKKKFFDHKKYDFGLKIEIFDENRWKSNFFVTSRF